MATTNLGLATPAYLSDGETGINAYAANFEILDNIFNYFVVDRVSGAIITNRTDGNPAISRIAIATGG